MTRDRPRLELVKGGDEEGGKTPARVKKRDRARSTDATYAREAYNVHSADAVLGETLRRLAEDPCVQRRRWVALIVGRYDDLSAMVREYLLAQLVCDHDEQVRDAATRSLTRLIVHSEPGFRESLVGRWSRSADLRMRSAMARATVFADQLLTTTSR